ncbi:MAG: cell division protein ZapA [Firmicutes bacterium]|nr:cell division protein ZapA [Bacillota bacterium]
MTAKNRVVLRIAGMDYAIRGAESEEYMHKLGLYVDKKMSEIMKNNSKLSTNMAAVLTALNVADDYIKAQENGAKLINEINKLREELQLMKAENERLKKENLDLVNLNNNLQLKLVKTETELREVRNSLEKLTRNK